DRHYGHRVCQKLPGNETGGTKTAQGHLCVQRSVCSDDGTGHSRAVQYQLPGDTGPGVYQCHVCTVSRYTRSHEGLSPGTLLPGSMVYIYCMCYCVYTERFWC